MAETSQNGGPAATLALLRTKLADAAGEIRATMPEHSPVSYEALAATALNIVANDPRIRDECSVESVVRSVARAARFGLQLDPLVGQAYLKPRWNKHIKRKECTMEIGYRGLIELASRSGRIAHVVARVVFERDEFDMDLANDKVRHIPYRGGDRGKATEVYGRITFANGDRLFDLLTRDEIEKIRQASDMPNGATWSEWWEEMAKKSAIRRILKNVSMSPEAQRAAVEDEYSEAGVNIADAGDGGNGGEHESGATAPRLTPTDSSLAREGATGAESKTPTAPAPAPSAPTPPEKAPTPPAKTKPTPAAKPAARAADLLPKARDLVGRMNAEQRARAQKDAGVPDLKQLRTADAGTITKFIAACEKALAA